MTAYCLKKFCLFSYFDELITCDSNFEPKPCPDAIIYLKEKYKLNKRIRRDEQEKQTKLDVFNSVNSEINNFNQEMKILENNNLDIENKLNNLKGNLNLKINLEKEKLKNKANL